jgi:hypothetical protein
MLLSPKSAKERGFGPCPLLMQVSGGFMLRTRLILWPVLASGLVYILLNIYEALEAVRVCLF